MNQILPEVNHDLANELFYFWDSTVYGSEILYKYNFQLHKYAQTIQFAYPSTTEDNVFVTLNSISTQTHLKEILQD